MGPHQTAAFTGGALRGAGCTAQPIATEHRRWPTTRYVQQGRDISRLGARHQLGSGCDRDVTATLSTESFSQAFEPSESGTAATEAVTMSSWSPHEVNKQAQVCENTKRGTGRGGVAAGSHASLGLQRLQRAVNGWRTCSDLFSGARPLSPTPTCGLMGDVRRPQPEAPPPTPNAVPDAAGEGGATVRLLTRRDVVEAGADGGRCSLLADDAEERLVLLAA